MTDPTPHFLYGTSESRHPGENFVFEKDKYRSRMTTPSLSQSLHFVKKRGVGL
ncbi:hypothetical protein SZ25_00543 [Candidatus Arcanobacter lacustris]|jgi:hypothetical protein|uniref:Uncharacterized protein n=1 Tax=Candidatus Arcanibacter lacustris TaxID=1607817 RepID=A0A0F5MNJ5_9RICK|nr:hypothetical protein SZ25_00543 [Candidatus Arcanobacter lacustris]